MVPPPGTSDEFLSFIFACAALMFAFYVYMTTVVAFKMLKVQSEDDEVEVRMDFWHFIGHTRLNWIRFYKSTISDRKPNEHFPWSNKLTITVFIL